MLQLDGDLFNNEITILKKKCILKVFYVYVDLN